MKHTSAPKAKDIQRTWYLVDVREKTLGRAAGKIAHLLMGKSKPNFVRNMDFGDHVVVINCRHIVVTGKKLNQKTYSRYSGYPSGLKTKTLAQLLAEKPTEPMRRAVYGMLPKNKIRNRLITRLYLYPQGEHPHMDKVSKETVW